MANEGLGWDPLQKMVHKILVVTVTRGGDNPLYIHQTRKPCQDRSLPVMVPTDVPQQNSQPKTAAFSLASHATTALLP